MSDIEFELDRAGVAEIAKSAGVQAAVAAAAQAVAAGVGADAYVDYYTTDRAAASVSIAVSAGDEAKRGRLASAATAAGLQYRGRL